MQQRDAGAKKLKVEIAGDDDLRDSAGKVRKIRWPQQRLHFGRNHSWPGADGVEEGCAQPRGGVRDAHESEKTDHMSTVEKRRRTAKRGFAGTRYLTRHACESHPF